MKPFTLLVSVIMLLSLSGYSEGTQKDSLEVTGMKFPEIKATSLAGSEVTLPDSAEGYVTLVAIAFERQAQGILDSWLAPFSENFGDTTGATFYEVPMIEGFWGKMFSKTIDDGMRRGIPEEKHKNVVTYYGDTGEYRRILSMDDKSLGYVFLLDRDGFIRWRGQGFATVEGIKEMIDAIKRVLQSR